MKRVNIGETIKQLNGEPVNLRERRDDKGEIIEAVPMTIKDALVVVLSFGRSSDPVQAMSVAHKLQHAEDGVVDLEDAEWSVVHDAAKTNTSYTNLVTAALLEALDNAEVG